ncbi:amidohydrolase family protein [Pigmentiphaga humi]|nr:amidohydrolase family protein [Pigmentiphaga humi]
MTLAGAAMLSTPSLTRAATAPSEPRAPHRIDVHHHIFPPKYVEIARERILSFAPNFAHVLKWTPAQSLEMMDRSGIRTAMVSLSNPGTWFGDVSEARHLARLANDYAAGMRRDHPERFGVLASLSLPDVEGSLKEIAYAYDVLEVDGVGLLTSYEDKWPGDDAFAPVFQELNRRKATVFFHPTSAACCSALMEGVAPPLIEYMFDTTRAIVSLLLSGALSKYRDIKFIFSHAGGATAPLIQRILFHTTVNKVVAERLPDGALADLKRLYFDAATSTSPANLGAILDLAGTDRIVLGTDFPYLPPQTTLPGLMKFGFASEDLEKIERTNALTLFPRLKTSAAG